MRAIDNYNERELDMLRLKGMLADPFADKPYDAKRSVCEAWQRACDKHGAQYANDIFPDGQPAWDEAAEHANDLRQESRLSDWQERNPSPESEAQ